jgi:DNA repair exonuclease SbcCD ATPase subunit
VTSIVELKQEFLKLLKEDEEFRLAVAGLLGYSEILKRLDRHEEEMKRIWESIEKLRQDFLIFIKEQERRWEENNRRWEENNKRWEENIKRWEENVKRWEENNKRWEENNRRWEESNKRWEENWRRWEENVRRWEENSRRWEEAYKRFEAIERRLSRVELSLGALTEVTLTRYVWEDLKEEIRFKGEEVITRLRSVIVDGFEVDMIVETNKNVYVVEVKVKPTIDDLRDLMKKVEVVRRRYGKQVIPILAGTLIGEDIKVLAKSEGVEVYTY